MNTRRLISCGGGRRPGTTAGGDMYGLIDWDDAPILIVGRSTEAVKREAIRIFASTLTDAGRLADAGSLAEDLSPFADQHPLPDPDGPIVVIDRWLDRLRRATATPWFAILEDEVVIAR